MTEARIRRTIDYGRMREATAGPGADTRTWCAMARVDDDPDAISYDENLGWLVDVTLQGGPLDQEQITCRVSAQFAGSEQTRQEPVERDCEVLVLIPAGNPNENPVILGQIHNGGGCQVPETVNGDDITEAFALGTHILVTPHNVDEQIAGTRRIKTADTHRILGPLVELADENAAQSFVRGDDQQAALDSFLSALDVWVQSVEGVMTPAPFPKPGLAAPLGVLQGAIASLKSSLQAALSTKVKGE